MSFGKPFDPTQLSGRALDFDAVKGSAWTDRSGNGNNGTAPGSAPTYVSSDSNYNNKATWHFASASAQEIDVTTLVLAQPMTIFIVGNDDGTATAQAYCWAQGAANEVMIMTNNPTAGINTFAGSVATFPSAPGGNVSTPRAIAAVFAGASSQLYVTNKAAASGQNPGTGGIGAAGGIFQIGKQINSFGLNGAIARFIVYSRALSNDEINSLMEWARTTYAIPISPCWSTGMVHHTAVIPRVEVQLVDYYLPIGGGVTDGGRDGLHVENMPGTGHLLFGGWNGGGSGGSIIWGNVTNNELWVSPSGRFGGDSTLLFPNTATPPETGTSAQPRWRHGTNFFQHVCLDGQTRLVLLGGDPWDSGYWTSYDPATNGFQSDVWLYGAPVGSGGPSQWTRQTKAAGWIGRWGQSAFSMPPNPGVTGRPNGTIYMFGGATTVDAVGDGSGLQDIWRSVDDGVTWTQIATTLPFGKRMLSFCSKTTASGKFLLVGGGLYSANSTPAFATPRDVWQFDNTETWTRLSTDFTGGAEGGRIYASVLYWPAIAQFMISNGYNSDTIQGNYGEVWMSPTGATWTKQNAIARANWPATHADQITVSPDGSHVYRQGGILESDPSNDPGSFDQRAHRLAIC